MHYTVHYRTASCLFVAGPTVGDLGDRYATVGPHSRNRNTDLHTTNFGFLGHRLSRLLCAPEATRIAARLGQFSASAYFGCGNFLVTSVHLHRALRARAHENFHDKHSPLASVL